MYNISLVKSLWTASCCFLFIAIFNTSFAATFNVATTVELRQALLDAAGNSQDDTIILADGAYATTDDGGGTFTFLDNESYGLTLQGSSSENVILSGDTTNQVFNFNVTGHETIISLYNMSIMYGVSAGYGGGIFSAERLGVYNCEISENIASWSGGGFYTAIAATVTNTILTGNSASGSWHGGGFYSNGTTIVTNSKLTGNSARYGGGFYSSRETTVANTILTGNSANTGGGFYNYIRSVTVTNSILTGNFAYTGGGFWTWGAAYVANSLFADNDDAAGIYLSSGEDHRIVNSIFLNNGSYDIAGVIGVIVSMNNNYIDETRINVSSFKQDNIFGGDLAFVDEANGDYHIGESSVLVDAGTTNIDGITSTDMDSNYRVVGTTIDIGPYEYQLITRPTINSFSYSGTPKVGEELTFSTNATPYDGRSISIYEIDYGDGSFIAASSSANYTYSIPGNYTARAKVTDSEGESSISSLNLTIADLTTEEKITQAYEDGEQYVQDNPLEFGFVTVAEKDQAVSDAEAAKDIIIADYAENVLYLLYGDFDMNSSVDGLDLSLFSKNYGHIAIDVDDDGDGYSEIQGDCDDTNITIDPDAAEICADGIDNNCDGQEDEGC